MRVCAHTHTPLSLSHYQLEFHPVSHPSVQMVRKAASMLSLFLSLPLHALYSSFKKKKEEKKKLQLLSTEAKHRRDTDRMLGGF